MKNKRIIILILVLVLSACLRLFKLDVIPVSLNWDEVDAGYNAYTIGNWGRDEWGEFMPLVFTSFRDDKHPVHIYSAVPFIKLFGLSDFITRFPSALIGIISVLIIYMLAFSIFGSYLTATFAALFLAISPYHLQFSRGLWESNFALFYFLLGLLLFYKAINGRKIWINFSFLSFGISLFSYHSSKIVVLPLVLLLIVLYIKDLKKLSLYLYTAIIILGLFITLLILNPRLTGLARVKQTQFSQSDIEKTQVFKKTNNIYLGMGEMVLNGLVSHFTPEYLFFKGDQTPRNSVKVFGEFYKIDALFLCVGLISLLWLRSRVTILVFAWLLMGPLPASLVQGAPNANRAIFVLGSMLLIAALGASTLVRLGKGKIKAVILLTILIVLSIQAFSFLKYYFTSYPKKDPHDWVYGMKQIVQYTELNDNKYEEVFMTDIRSQPYIFFLYYLKYPLPDFLRRVSYNQLDSKSFSTVSYFGKYYFEGWDPIESMPNPGVLYIVSPSQYDGLRHKSEFDVKKTIYYPDGSIAFFIVSSK